jgi:hypothetical protein
MSKTFDAVKFQRKARAELSSQYLADRELFLKELAEKHGRPRKSKSRRSLVGIDTQTTETT